MHVQNVQMKCKSFSSIILLFLSITALCICPVFAQDTLPDFADVFENLADSALIENDESAEIESNDTTEQDNFNDLFTNESIDTTRWSTTKINGAWFDYKTMTETVTIPLIDSLRNLHFTYPAIGNITSQFGLRRGLWHYGVDIKVKVGDTIRCAFDGKVRVIQNDRRGYGKVVVIRHHSGLETLYGHLSKPLVSTNQEIKSGEALGLGGNTGRSTGSHLHFESRYRGEPFNPNTLIDVNQYALKNPMLALAKADFEYLTESRKAIVHYIRRGETLGSIARRYRTSVRQICALNGLSKRTILRVGKRIVIRKTRVADIKLALKETPQTQSSNNATNSM